MPDRLLSLMVLVGAWVPPAVAGWAAAEFARRRTTTISPALLYLVLATVVVAWAAAWFLFNLGRMPPYIPGSSKAPTYAPPEAVRGLLIFTGAVVLPAGAIACALAYRRRKGTLRSE